MDDNNKQKQDQAVHDAALHKVEFIGLSKDEIKAVNAYNNVVQQGLAVFNGEPLAPTKKIGGNAIDGIIEELILEDQKVLHQEFKDGFRQILKDKIALDAVITAKQKEFNKAVVAEKKAFTQKAGKVLSIIDDIHKRRASYVQTLTVDVVDQKAENNDDKEDADKADN